MKKISILLILTMIISLIPALNISAADEYYLYGLYQGATVVVQHEPTKTVTLVSSESAGTLSEAATDVSKVVFTFNDGAPVTDAAAPFKYDMTFTYCGVQTLKYDVYKTGNASDTPNESKTITFNAVAGTKNAASFTENFEGPFANTEALAKAFIGNNGTNYASGNLTPVTVEFNGSNALMLDATPKAAPVELRGAACETGHKVHYYEFDVATGYSYKHSFSVRGNGYSAGSTNSVDLFHSQLKINGSWYFNPATKVTKVGVVLDYNETPTATIYFDGKELNRVSLQTAVDGSSDPVFVIAVHQSGNPIYIDNFKYSVYDVKEAPSFTVASIPGGDKPVLETLSEICFAGADYLDGQSLAGKVTISERANNSDGDFVASDIGFTPSINGADMVVSFNEELATGTTYKVSISGVQDSYLNYYNDYSFTFRTLNQGENPLPEITLTSPVADERYYPNEDTITLSADAFDTLGGSISKVEFYADGELIGEGTNTAGDTYTYDWVLDDSIDKSEPVAITAKAIDNEGGTNETTPVNIVIWSKQLPEITITSPAQDTTYCANLAGVDIEVKPTIEFTAEDADGAIQAVTIYVDGVIDGTPETTATSYTLINQLTVGEHSILIEVYDDHGLRSTDDVDVIVKNIGKSGYLLDEDYAATNLLAKWYNKGSATLSNGSLTGCEDIKGVIISATDATANTAERPVEENLTETSFATDIKVAFNNTTANRVVMLNSTELATFTADGKITFNGAEKGTYVSGVTYNVSAVVDAENDKIYALVDGTKIGEKSATFAIDPFIKISHQGVGETAIVSANVSGLGDSVTPTVTYIDETHFSVDFVAGTDVSTLEGNVLLVDSNGKAVNLGYKDGVFTVNQVLKATETYQVVVLPDVRDINGNGYSGSYRVPFTVAAPAVVVAEVSCSGSLTDTTYSGTVTVDFGIGAQEAKTVYLVCAAYKGAKMVDYDVIPVTAPATASQAISLMNVDAETVIEAFVVDSMDDLNTVTDKILKIK